MGCTFEVNAWVKQPTGSKEDYLYIQQWTGESFFRALFELAKAKRAGHGCVKLEWRG